MFTQLLFVEGQFLGEAKREKVFVHADLVAPWSVMLYCGVCGDAWARCPVTMPDGRMRPWIGYRAPCRRHPDATNRPGGTLYLPWLEEIFEALTEGALRREMDLWWNFLQGTENERF